MSAAPLSFLPRRRARVPTVLQQETTECGAACLAMVLAAHGQWTPLAELRERCGVGRDGVKASNLLTAAREAGLLAKGLRLEFADLAGLACPFIVFWNSNHFVVVEHFRLRGGRLTAWINDPAGGPRAVGRQEFEHSYSGVALTFERTPAFSPRRAQGRLADLANARLRGFGAAFGIAFLSGLLLVAPGLVAAGVARAFVDGVIVGGARAWLWWIAGGMAALALLRALLTRVQKRVLARAQTGLAIATSREQMWRLLHLDLGFFMQRFAGEVAGRFALIDRLAGILTGGLAPGAISLVSLGAFGGALFGLDVALASIVAAAAVLALAALLVSSRATADSARRLMRDEARLQAATAHGLSIASDLKAHGIERIWLSRWMGYLAKVVDAEQRSNLIAQWLGQLPQLIMALAGTAVLIVGGYRVMGGQITIGVLLAFQTLMGSFNAPVLALVGLGAQMRQARAIAERLDDIVNYPLFADGASAQAPAPERGMTLEGVGLVYGPFSPPVLEDVSFQLPPGARVALVGFTGSGKSSVGRVAAGLVEPTQGGVALFGVPLSAWPRPTLRTTLAYLEQEPGLFEGSARDNIALWDPSMSHERVVRAARDARAHEFIAARDRGYDFRVAEGGANLSGGERQRLALARALAVDPLLLVLDEATSALDPLVEKEVMDAIRRRGCACLIIAHRLSTVRDCDLILVMEKGRIVERGAHRDLIARGGLYARLIET